VGSMMAVGLVLLLAAGRRRRPRIFLIHLLGRNRESLQAVTALNLSSLVCVSCVCARTCIRVCARVCMCVFCMCACMLRAPLHLHRHRWEPLQRILGLSLSAPLRHPPFYPKTLPQAQADKLQRPPELSKVHF
jgi:hypothetical protein